MFLGFSIWKLPLKEELRLIVNEKRVRLFLKFQINKAQPQLAASMNCSVK